MTELALTCLDEQRRHIVRDREFNGLDFLEVDDDQLTLTVHLLGRVPEGLDEKNFRITGGRRITGIRVVDFELCAQDDEEADDCLKLKVDMAGDFSVYTLSVVDGDANDPSIQAPFPGFDVRYAKLDFTFKASCPSDLDCKPQKICPPPLVPELDVNYLAKDYSSFRQLLLDRLAQTMPDWKERHIPDLGITLVELLAYLGDHLSYFQDAAATEAYLDTARQRISVHRHARLVDYPMHEGCNARTWVAVEASGNVSIEDPQKVYFITKFDDAPPEGSVLKWEDLQSEPGSRFEVFAPLFWNNRETLEFHQAHNEIHFYDWEDKQCCLPRGATTATLVDEWGSMPLLRGTQRKSTQTQEPPSERPRKLELAVGDVLIFEEKIGPKTGDPADADPSHRHAVCLTRVAPGVDALNDRPIVEIEWAQEDALPFPLCISAVGPAPECRLLENISVAYGNVVLVDHGRHVENESLGQVPIKSRTIQCKREGRPEETIIEPEKFRPRLQKAPLTFSQPLVSKTSARELIAQDPKKAKPQIRLKGVCHTAGGVVHDEWSAEPDLLASRRNDCHFVVEMDNDGHAHLRFGDDELGHMPEAETQFTATYRIGNGLAGNVGAETISYVVLKSTTLSGVTLKPRNPLPAQGGVESQVLQEVKKFAPTAFRKQLERAITPGDYARLAERHPRVQRAAAAFRWMGSWYEVLVAIDPFGKVETEQKLLDEVAGYLFRYRRMGHDLAVQRAHYVPLDIALIVCVLPGYLRGHIKQALLEVFSDEFLPDGSKGFFHPDNLTFGQGIRLSKLVAAAQAVPGVESVSVTKLERLFQGPNQEIENGILPLSLLEIARLDNDPSFPENGRLELDVRGGR